MTMSFAVKDGVPSMRFETHDSASMLFRHVDIDLAAYSVQCIELPICSSLDERTREGDDHPARLFLRFLTNRGVGEGVTSCPRAGCGKSACPVR